jgi:hypothetical protein
VHPNFRGFDGFVQLSDFRGLKTQKFPQYPYRSTHSAAMEAPKPPTRYPCWTQKPWRLAAQVGAVVPRKLPFTPEEDAMLLGLVRQLGHKHWLYIASWMPHRSPRQCRERWLNYLNPELSQSPWTPAEDDTLRAKYAELGPKWVKISKCLSNRSVNNIKNRALVLDKADKRLRMAACARAKDGEAKKGGDPLEPFFADTIIDIFEDEMSHIFSLF